MTALRIADAHCHFFSRHFFSRLALERDSDDSPEAAAAIVRMLGWEEPAPAEELAARWVAELDANGVERAVLIASVPTDAESVARAVERFPSRFVGFFMVDPTAPEATDRVQRTLQERPLSGLCLFPAMHRYDLRDPLVGKVFEAAAEQKGTAVFVHCGVLSVGVRDRLGLTSRFESFRANPLHLEAHARRHPEVPVILPHFGAGLLREALMLAELCPNVFLDTSSSNRWTRYTPGLTLEQVFRQALELLGPGRLLFGTDSSFFPRGWNREVFEAQRQLLEDLGASPKDRQRIFADNFSDLFPGDRPH